MLIAWSAPPPGSCSWCSCMTLSGLKVSERTKENDSVNHLLLLIEGFLMPLLWIWMLLVQQLPGLVLKLFCCRLLPCNLEQLLSETTAAASKNPEEPHPPTVRWLPLPKSCSATFISSGYSTEDPFRGILPWWKLFPISISDVGEEEALVLMQIEDELAAALENGVVVAGGRGTGRLTKTQEGVAGGQGDAAVVAASEESLGDKRMRQTGQVGCFCSQESTQEVWKMWPQMGNWRSTSDAAYSTKQIGHLLAKQTRRSSYNKKEAQQHFLLQLPYKKDKERVPTCCKEGRREAHNNFAWKEETDEKSVESRGKIKLTHWLFSSWIPTLSSLALIVGKASNTSFSIPTNCCFCIIIITTATNQQAQIQNRNFVREEQNPKTNQEEGREDNAAGKERSQRDRERAWPEAAAAVVELQEWWPTLERRSGASCADASHASSNREMWRP